ncbi:hypothetical protein Ciccas_013118, partial [Cichlidogyrus casuarinus]
MGKDQVTIIPDESSTEQYSSTDEQLLCGPEDCFTCCQKNTLNVPAFASYTTSTSHSSLGIGSMTSSKTSSIDPSLQLHHHHQLVSNGFSSIFSSNSSLTHKNDQCESGVQSDKNSTDSPALKSTDDDDDSEGDQLGKGFEWLDSMLGGEQEHCHKKCFYQLFQQHFQFMKHVHNHLMLNSDVYKCQQQQLQQELSTSKSLFALPKNAKSTCSSCQQHQQQQHLHHHQRGSSFKRGRCSSNDEVNISVSPSLARVTEKFIPTETAGGRFVAAAATESGSSLKTEEELEAHSKVAIVKPSLSSLQASDRNQLASNISRLAINEGKHPNRLYAIVEPRRGNPYSHHYEAANRRNLRMLNNHVSFQSDNQSHLTTANGYVTTHAPYSNGRRSLPNSFAPNMSSKASFRRLRKSFRRPRLSITKSHLFGHFSFSSRAEDPSISLLGIAQKALSMAHTLS